MKRHIIFVAIFGLIASLAGAASADLGISDIGEKGLAVIQVADVVLNCNPGGNGTAVCSMPADNAAWSVSENAGRVQFNINYRFNNQRPVQAQTFTLGYTVDKKDGTKWVVVADKAVAVEKSVAAGAYAAGVCVVPAQKLDKSGGTFRITVRFTGCDVAAPPVTRVVTVDKVL